MIIENHKPIRFIGYHESSMVETALAFVSLETRNQIEVITPEEFLALNNKDDYQYLVTFCIDMKLRKEICKLIDDSNLDCITWIHDAAVICNDCKIGKGVIIGQFTSALYSTVIENHCYIEPYCLIAHHVHLGKACVVHTGTLIAGRTTVGENCTFKYKSGTIGKVVIVNDVTIGALSHVTKDITQSGRYLGSIARYVGE